MKKLISISLLLIISCTQTKQEDPYVVLVDRVWMTELNKTQYYYSSTDGFQFLWSKFERRNGGTYTPFSLAKGTPYTHPLPRTYSGISEGWHISSYFKINQDSIYLQDEEDIDANYLISYKIKVANDTVIGIVKYNKIILENKHGKRGIISKYRD